MKFAPFALTAAALTLGACGDGRAQVSEDRVRNIVRDYLMENPELIREALIELQTREQASAQEAVRTAAVSLTPEIVSDPRVPAIGPEDAKVTIVEFFDYNCSYCQLAASWIQDTLEAHPNDVRVVFRDYPILNSRTGTSIEAAEAALAAANQGKFKEMHFALYGASGGVTSEQIDQIAQEAGVDVAQMRADMESSNYGELFADNMVLGEQIGIEGTPFFMVGDRIVAGADIEKLEESLEAELAEG